ncbi:NAD(P)/FAD-dependent oxidoreductase [Maribacter sp. 2307ULW6-5]|uniref:NAD(P)/FAD-dependent oxidoreductase n=1 Tax=Maribacter sp. 2307ULW6-5 TaxID=3386275 RepID=UPI0039BD3F48
MGKHIGIIGGGIVGLSCAYYLQKAGHQVTLWDKGDLSSGASFVNAGYLTPSHIVPLAHPGMVAKGLRMMFHSDSPFYMKPRWNTDFFKWSWYFHRSSTPKKVERAIPVIKEINLLSRGLYQDIKNSGDLGDFHLERNGLLMLYQTEAAYLHEKQVADRAAGLGLEVRELNQDEVRQLEPNVNVKAEGAIHYQCDGHMTPTEFMPKMVAYLRAVGVTLGIGQNVQELQRQGKKITQVKTDRETTAVDEVVLAAGAWSPLLLRQLGTKLSLEAGKGYRINVPEETGIHMPAILMEASMAVTPMRGFTRFAGTMEFSGINDIIRKERVLALAKGAKRFYPELEIDTVHLERAETGMRPVSPDGLPYIGRSSAVDNLILATGHAMMGWSLGPATGLLVSQIADHKAPEMDLSAFHPERSFP